jgi:Flp pilus assembly protein TadG
VKEKGQATVEFALVMPLVFLVVFALFEFGHAFWVHQQLTAAANEGARTAVVLSRDSSAISKIQAAARGAAPGLTASGVNVNVVSTWQIGRPVKVTATYHETINVMGITFFDGNLKSTTTMKVQS